MNPKPPSLQTAVSKETEELLEKMGTKRVLADLRSKYKQPEKSESASLESNSISGSSLADLSRKTGENQARVKDLPTNNESYTSAELDQFTQVQNRLNQFIAEFNSRFQYLDKSSAEYKSNLREATEEVIAYLDSSGVWDYKFSTQNAGGASHELEIIYTVDDSIYYMTRKGVSVRIRKSSIGDGYGIDKVIQPIMEKTFFMRGNADDTLEIAPQIGLSVRDCITKEFEQRLKVPLNSDFTSPLTVWIRGDKVAGFGGPYNMYVHEGDKVNMIFTLP